MLRILLVMIWLLPVGFGQQQSAEALINQGNELRVQRDWVRAEERYLAATQGAGTQEQIAKAWNNLGAVRFDRGRFAEAGKAYLEPLRVHSALGRTTEDAAVVMTNLGELFRSEGLLAKAEEYLRQALELRERLFGHDSLQTVNGLNSVSCLLHDRGDFVNAT